MFHSLRWTDLYFCYFTMLHISRAKGLFEVFKAIRLCIALQLKNLVFESVQSPKDHKSKDHLK